MAQTPDIHAPAAPLASQFLERLARIVGETDVRTDPADCWPYGYDNSRRQALPQAVAFASAHEEVRDLVRLCNEFLVPLVARGLGSSTTGSSVPVTGGLVLALERMNRILHVDSANRALSCETGATNAAVQAAAGTAGFFWAPDPTSAAYSTVGGNLACGDPLTDPGASLIALDAEVVLTSSQGQRKLRLDEFFIDYYQTALEPGELLTEIHVPPATRHAWAHIKFTPRSVEDFATVGVAVTLRAKDGTCDDVRLALNSVASTIVRAKQAEEVLCGKPLTDPAIREMGEIAATEVDPTDDNRGSADYKRDLVKVLVPRAVQEAMQRIV